MRTSSRRLVAVMLAQVGRIPLDDAELMVARQAMVEPVLWTIEQVQADGTLRSDVAFGDIDVARMRLSRPLPQEFSRDLDSSLAHRCLALVLAGLRGEAEGRHRSAARP
jgi:hypothetical protein